MKKNQKYTQEEMFLAIELWEESGISQQKYSRKMQVDEENIICCDITKCSPKTLNL